MWALLAVGVLARTVRYLSVFPLWGDEAALAANLLDRGFFDLLRPLDHEQLCPIGFLWTQLALVRLFGFTELILRLPAFVCGIASLFLFKFFAGRLLKGTALLMAVGVFAVSYPAVRYAAEAKPYGCDEFFALALLAVAVQWLHSDLKNRWLWLLCALMPVCALFSYPTVFIAGGTSLTIAYTLWSTGVRRGWMPWAACNATLLLSLAAAYFLFLRGQSNSELATMQSYWQEAFPPLAEPLKLIRWFFDVHAGQMLAYPVGGSSGGSAGSFILCSIALAVLWRRRQFPLLMLCLAPLALTFAAASMGLYPYGGMVRFQLNMAAIFCLLIGFGLSVLLAWFPEKMTIRRLPPSVSAVVLLMCVAAASIARDAVKPERDSIDVQYRNTIRRLWANPSMSGEVVCLKTDLGLSFSPASFSRRAAAMYLCNQRIYSPRHAAGEPPRWERVSRDWPLVCVEFASTQEIYYKAARWEWFQEMDAQYECVSVEQHPLGDCDDAKRTFVPEAYVFVYTFTPREIADEP
jgi:hypothetical protein